MRRMSAARSGFGCTRRHHWTRERAPASTSPNGPTLSGSRKATTLSRRPIPWSASRMKVPACDPLAMCTNRLRMTGSIVPSGTRVTRRRSRLRSQPHHHHNRPEQERAGQAAERHRGWDRLRIPSTVGGPQRRLEDERPGEQRDELTRGDSALRHTFRPSTRPLLDHCASSRHGRTKNGRDTHRRERFVRCVGSLRKREGEREQGSQDERSRESSFCARCAPHPAEMKRD